MAKLTTKQARFIEEYTLDYNATQAAIRAGYSEHTAHAIGRENLHKPAIKDAVDKHLREKTQKIDITVEEILKDLLWAKDYCIKEKQLTNLLKTCELLGKYKSMWKEKIDITHREFHEELLDYIDGGE